MRYLLLSIVFVLSACDSPMNNRVTSESANALKIKALSFAKFNLTAEVQWVNAPVGNIKVDNTLFVMIKNNQGQLTSIPKDLTLNFYAVMPSMGHPMEDAGFFTEVSEGVYINKNIRYNMAGDWNNQLWIMDAELEIKGKVEWADYF